MKTVKVAAKDLKFFPVDCDDIESDGYPGCCSLGVVNNFPQDSAFASEFGEACNEYADNLDEAEFKFPTLVEAKPEMVKRLVELIDEHCTEIAHMIVLGSTQKLAQEAALKAGFKKVGTYKGRSDGTMTVFQKGLRWSPR
jgi:hypothetical protein